MATTPNYAIPYPVGTDRVMDGDNAMQAIAERVDTLLATSLGAAWQTLTPNYGSSDPALRPLGYRRIGKMVYCRGRITGLSGGLGVNTTIFTFPAGYLPTGNVILLAPMGATGGWCRLYVNNGLLQNLDAIPAGGWLGLDSLFFSTD